MNNLPIQQDIIDRLVFVNEFQDGQPQLDGAPNGQLLINMYQPRDLIDFNLKWKLHDDHLAVRDYQEVITVPADKIPTFVAPNIPQDFPQPGPNIIQEPKNTSFLRLLIPMKHAGVDFRHYNFICERNSLRRIGMNSEEYVMGVIRYGNTLLLRRYEHQIPMNMNDVGHVFEQMCTRYYPPGATYNKLIVGNIGNLRTLITAEIDAVENGRSIELKCKKRNDHFEDIWLQAYLSGIETVTIGYRSNDRPPRLIDLNNRPTNQMIDEQRQINILQRIHQVLLFLQTNVEQDVKQERSYLLIRYEREQKKGLFLYEVTNRNDKRRLIFAPSWLFDNLKINIT